MDADARSETDARLRAGVAVYNAGEHHAAHDVWEERWLALDEGGDDERLLKGLIQLSAAVHHGDAGNWEGLRGLAESAAEYLADLPDDHRGVNVAAVRAYLAALAADPEHVERADPVPLAVDGERVTPAELGPEATLLAADALAEAFPDGVESGVAYARDDLAAGEEGSRFLALAFDFVRDADRRALVAERLAQHAARREARDRDVEGLFD